MDDDNNLFPRILIGMFIPLVLAFLLAFPVKDDESKDSTSTIKAEVVSESLENTYQWKRIAENTYRFEDTENGIICYRNPGQGISCVNKD